jgi:hypothetical protein
MKFLLIDYIIICYRWYKYQKSIFELFKENLNVHALLVFFSKISIVNFYLIRSLDSLKQS